MEWGWRDINRRHPDRAILLRMPCIYVHIADDIHDIKEPELIRRPIPIRSCEGTPFEKKRPHKPHYWLGPNFNMMMPGDEYRCPGRGKYARKLYPKGIGLEPIEEPDRKEGA